MSERDVQVLNIFGQSYAIRAPEHEQALLERAAALLQERLAQSEEQYPKARSLELLVLTALNLCVPLSQHEQVTQEWQQRLDATVAQISAQLERSEQA